MQSKLLFLLAIFMGVITTAVFFYSSQSETPEPTESVPMVDVVVLAEDVEENQRITEEHIQYQSVPEDQVHPSAISSFEDVQGKFATADMVTGELLLSHRLKSSQEEQAQVSRKVNEGHRAISIGVDIVRSVSNLIHPEDYVDVIFTYERDEDTPGNNRLRGQSENLLDQMESVLLLEKVRVLSVGKRMVTQEDGTQAAEYSQVTLELTPEDSVAVVNAAEQGSIHLSLHSKITEDEE